MKGSGRSGDPSVNLSGDEPVSEPKLNVKSFDISKRLVFQAWEKVQSNAGAPGAIHPS